MTIPDDVVEAAAKAFCRQSFDFEPVSVADDLRHAICAALEAAAAKGWRPDASGERMARAIEGLFRANESKLGWYTAEDKELRAALAEWRKNV